MPFMSGQLTGTTASPATYAFLDVVKNFAVSNGWEVIMSNTATENHFYFLKGPGLTGEDHVYVGLNTYQSDSAGYYNIAIGCANGYLSTQTYYNQPQFKRIGIPLAYDRISYWLHINAQRIAFVCRVATSYYEHGYAGKFIPYFSPLQYPYPVFVGGMFGYDINVSKEDDDNIGILAKKKYDYIAYQNAPYIGMQNRYQTSYKDGFNDRGAHNGQVYSSFNNKWAACEKITAGSGPLEHEYTSSELNGNRPVYNIDLAIVYDENPQYQRLNAGVYGTLDGVYLIDSKYPEVYAEDTFTVGDYEFIAFPPVYGKNAEILLQTND